MARQKQGPRPVEAHPASLQFDYIQKAAYFYFRAADESENLESVLARQLAGYRQRDLEQRGIAVPEPEQVYAYAQVRWPAHRLHPL